ncbi:hypothetical protein [Methylomonas koyamae]|uniref:Uncharacterized protein n=1 Tax=Methylomonas koyamae TaxID=702114 RepID=A0A291IPL9_9GAMM|nr:hypothetical protein [Methylomonas koyamae]ATG92170.1 hypothetical protein MKLM6_3995 [Methylomonas koyamae]OAI27354.1 hypothetical protein A1356_09495 [Methylomonas koyamae]
MKKIILVCSLLLLMGCAEKDEYQNEILEQMKTEKDIKDYKIAPEEMTKCVVDTSSSNMPGLILIDPQRRQAYKNYTKMLKLNKSGDPKKTLEELRQDFGDAKKLADAHSNYVESVVDCMSNLVSSTEEAQNKQK